MTDKDNPIHIPETEIPARIDADAFVLMFLSSYFRAEGNQVLQVDLLTYAAKKALSLGMTYDPELQEMLKPQLGELAIPGFHPTVGDEDKVAQFSYWWDNMFDIFNFQFTGDPRYIPSSETLQERAARYAQDRVYDSFREDKVARVALRMREVSDVTSYDDIMERFLLPQLIMVEKDFQIPHPEWNRHGRPRENSKKRFTSVFLANSLAARRRVTPQHLFQIIDRDICIFLDNADLNSQIQKDYKSLIDAYNTNNPNAQRPNLHKEIT